MTAGAFSLLVKPASADCNLRCRYCFYLPKQKLFAPAARRMAPDTLETLIRRFLACPMPVHAFAWQGGEPTLMGRAFFREAVRLQQHHAPPGARIANALQTNGTLLDDAWGRFLKEHRFLVGLSLDGPEPLHNRHRRTAAGVGAYEAAARGLKILKEHRVDVNVLTLVSDANQQHPETVYRHLKSLGVKHHQYLECVETAPDGQRRPYALAPGRWGAFLCRLFDEWYKADTETVSIRLFDAIVSRLATGVPTQCSLSGNCCGALVVEAGGDVFPCDFAVTPAWRLGNIRETDFAALRSGEAYRRFGARKDPRPLSPRCGDCRYLPLCLGDCPKNRRAGVSVLCGDWIRFFDHTLTRFERLAARVGRPR